MNEQTVSLPKSFYWIASLAVVWNLIGIASYLAQVTMSPEAIAQLPIEQQPLYRDIPAWATSAYAIAVTAGVIGSVLLLLRKSLSMPFLALSLAGIIMQMAHAFLLTDALDVLGITSVILPLFLIAVAIALLWYFHYCRKQGWII